MKPPECNSCVLEETGGNFTQIEGTGSSGVLVMLEAPGQHEDQDRLPARPQAPSGSVLQGIIRRISGLDRNQLTISNILRCRPPKNWLDGAPYEHSAIEKCQIHARKTINERRPRCIVAMGAIPTRTITGLSGYNQGIKLLRGFIIKSSRPEYILDGVPIPVVPTFHPSHLLRASKTRSKDAGEIVGGGGKEKKTKEGMSLSGVVSRDIQLALSIARNGFQGYRKVGVVKGTREVMDQLIRETQARPELPLGWDIETPRSIDFADDESEIDTIQANVTQIQFALDSSKGYVFPGFNVEWVKEGTRKLLSLPNRKYTWNGWQFDNKVVHGHYGIPILGEDIDLMKAWSWIQPDLPEGLQFATSFYAPDLHPWKHLVHGGFPEDDGGTPWGDDNSKEMDTYGACDVISLHINAEGIFKVMADRGLRTSFDRHCLLLRQEMISASRRGFPVDPERHEQFGDKVLGESLSVQEEIRKIIPEPILKVEPRRKSKGFPAEYGYVKTPKQISDLLDVSGNPKDGSDRCIITESIPVLDEDDNETGTVELKSVVYVRRGCEVFNKETLEMGNVQRWCRLKPFSVGSPDQKIDYIKFRREEEIARRMKKGQNRATAERLCSYKVPKVKNKNKELKDNTGAVELQKLYKVTEDPVFKLLVDVGKLKKMHGTYVKGWKVKNGYVHTTFGVADTGTGQLSSTDPNIQNAPKHSALGKEFRFCICAKPGRLLLEFDK